MSPSRFLGSVSLGGACLSQFSPKRCRSHFLHLFSALLPFCFLFTFLFTLWFGLIAQEHFLKISSTFKEVFAEVILCIFTKVIATLHLQTSLWSWCIRIYYASWLSFLISSPSIYLFPQCSVLESQFYLHTLTPPFEIVLLLPGLSLLHRQDWTWPVPVTTLLLSPEGCHFAGVHMPVLPPSLPHSPLCVGICVCDCVFSGICWGQLLVLFFRIPPASFLRGGGTCKFQGSFHSCPCFPGPGIDYKCHHHIAFLYGFWGWTQVLLLTWHFTTWAVSSISH